MNSDRLVVLFFFTAGDVYYVLVFQFHVGYCAFKYAHDVDALYLQRAVSLHTVHHGVVADCVLRQAVSSLHKGLYGSNLSAYLIHARTEDCTLNLHHVLIAVQGGVYADGVLVHELEVAHVKLTNTEHRILLSCLAVDADGLCIGVTCESSGISHECGGTLCLFHLVEHRALHFSCDVHKCLVGTDGDDVIVLQTHVASELAVE